MGFFSDKKNKAGFSIDIIICVFVCSHITMLSPNVSIMTSLLVVKISLIDRSYLAIN